MSQRRFSVMVVPDRWEGEDATLANRLAPMTSQSPRQLERAMQRGAFAVETDLSRDEADTMCRRFARLDLPLRIVDDQGEVVRETWSSRDDSSESRGADDPERRADDVPRETIEETLGSILDEEADALADSIENATLGEADSEAVSELESVDPSGTDTLMSPGPALHESENEGGGGTASSGGTSTGGDETSGVNDAGEDETEDDPWSEVVGRPPGTSDSSPSMEGEGTSELESVSPDAYGWGGTSEGQGESTEADDEVATLSTSPSDFSVEGASESSTPSPDDAPADSFEPSSSGRSSEAEESLDRGESTSESPPEPDVEFDALAGERNETESATGSEARTASTSRSASNHSAPTPESASTPDSPSSEASEAESNFDSTRMTEALTESAGPSKAPYEPDSFDDRPEHVPALAALLSIVAPGAGQIYNGQSEEGWNYVWKALLIWPWLEGVAQAYRRAESIRDYQAPPPERGSLKRALLHVPLWCGGVASVVLLVVGTGRLVESLRHAPETSSTSRAVAASRAVEGAEFDIQRARVQAQSRAMEERGSSDERFTMDDGERAQRLFRIGYEHCRAHKYKMCESTMGRVTQLSDELRRKALRLQAWASGQKNPELPRRPMPDVSIDQPELSDYEPASAPDSSDRAPPSRLSADAGPSRGHPEAESEDRTGSPRLR